MTDNLIATRVIGQVKWFNTKAGYGFITIRTSEDETLVGKDIFVHFSSISVVNSQYRYLVQGEYVEFDVVKNENDKYEYHASDITGFKRGLLMCETRSTARPTPSRRKGEEGPTDAAEENPEANDDGFQRVVSKRSYREATSSAKGARPVKIARRPNPVV